MPNIDLTNVEESTGEYQTLVPGAYVLTITSAEPNDEKQYAFIVWDVAEGEFAGIYKDSNWPPRDVLSWTEKALGMLKHKLHVLADDNPGWNVDAAFQTDNWAEFRGRKFGAVIRERLYTRNDGTEGKGIEIARWVRTSEVPELQAGFKADPSTLPKPRDSREATKPRTAPPAQQQTAMYDADIPF